MTARYRHAQPWRPTETIDVRNDAEVRSWAKQLHVTPTELREIIAECGDRAARVATEVGVPLRAIGG